MTLVSAIKFLKGAVQRNLPGGAPSTYVFCDGVVYARGAGMLAAYPVPHILGTFALAADDIERALARMPAEPQISAGNGTIVFKAGRLRSSCMVMAADEPGGKIDPNAAWQPPPTQLLEVLRTVLPFVSPDGTWQRSAKLETGRVLALSDKSAIEVLLPNLNVGNHNISLAVESVAYLAALDKAPTGMLADDRSLSFLWANGAWARCQLMAQAWPDGIADRLLARDGDDAPPIDITPEWRGAFDDIDALGDGTITVGPDGLTGNSRARRAPCRV